MWVQVEVCSFLRFFALHEEHGFLEEKENAEGVWEELVVVPMKG